MAQNNVVELIFRANNQTAAGIGSVTQGVTGLSRSIEAGPLGALGRLSGAFAGIAGAAGVGLVVAGFSKLVKAGVEVQETVENLKGAVIGAGGDLRKFGGELEATVQQLHKATRFDDEEIRRGLTSIIQLSGQVKASEESLAAVADFAAARHISFAQAAELVGKASEGMSMNLRRSGVGLEDVAKGAYNLLTPTQRLQLGIAGTATGLATLAQKAFEAATPTERLAITTSLLNQKFGGAAARDMATYAGQMAHFREEAKDLAEVVGTKLVDNLAKATVQLKQFVIAWNEAAHPGAVEGQPFLQQIVRGPDPSRGPIASFLEAKAAQSQYSTATDAANDALVKAMRTRRESATLAAEEKKKNDELVASVLARAAAEEAAKKAAEEAAAEYKKYLEILHGFLGTSREQVLTERAVLAAAEQITHGYKQSAAAADLFDAAMKKLGIDSIETSNAILKATSHIDVRTKPGTAGTGQDALYFAESMGLGLAAQDAERLRKEDAARKLMIELEVTRRSDSFKRAGEQIQRDMEKAAQLFVERFEGPMTDLFADLGITGGQNFGRIVGQMLEQAVHASANDFVKLLEGGLDRLFGGGQITKTGTGGGAVYSYGGQEGLTFDQAQALQTQNKSAWGTRIAAGVGGASQLYGAISGQQRQSAVGLILSQAAAGYTVSGGPANPYSWIGAVVGAVVGAIGALVAPAAGKDYPYGRFGVRDGRAFFTSNAAGGSGGTGELQNISLNMQAQAKAQIQKVYDDTIGDFIKTLLRIPTEFLPQMFASIHEILPQIGKDAGGDIGRAASQSFWKDFELWFREGLPRDIGEHVKPIFAQALEGMGFTVARFNEIWTALGDMDPADARKALDQLTEAAVGMRQNFKYLSQSASGLLETGTAANQQTFAQQLHDSADQIYRLAAVFNDLPISQQIAAAAEINRLTKERVDLEKQFFRELAQTIQDVTRSFDAQIRDLTAQGFKTKTGAPDLQAQAQYYLDYANSLRARIAAASSPQEAQQLGQELQSTLGTILSLGQQLGPKAGEEFRKWAIAALAEGRDLVVDRLKALGDAVAAENREFMDRMKKDWDEFTGNAVSAAAALDNLTNAINAFKDSLTTGGGGPGGGGGYGGAGGPGNEAGGSPPAPGAWGGAPVVGSFVWQYPFDPNAGTGAGHGYGPGIGRGVIQPFGAGQAQITDGEQVVSIGEEIGASLVAALSRSDALKAIAEAGRGLSALSQTPTPLPIISVTPQKPEITIVPAPPALVPIVPPAPTPVAPPEPPRIVVTPPPPAPTPMPPAQPPVVPIVDRTRDAALSTIAAVLGQLNGRAIPDLTGALKDAGGAFSPLPTGPWTGTEGYTPTHMPGYVPPAHPFFSLNDPTSPVLTPDIWASWNSMQREAGVPETARGQSGDRVTKAIVEAIRNASAGESKGMQALAGMLKLLEWLPGIAKAIENKSSGPITIVLPPNPVTTSSAGPSSRRGR